MEFQRFIVKPSTEMYAGIRVTKDTDIEYKNDNVEQTIKDLVLHSVSRMCKEEYETIVDTTVRLNEGDVLIFEDEGRGYIKPAVECMSVAEAIEELSCIKDMV